MQYLNEFLIEVVSLEVKFIIYKENDEEFGQVEFKSIDLSHYDENQTNYKNRLEHLRLRSQTEILLLNETGILYQLNRIYIIKEVLTSFLNECNEVIDTIASYFPRDDKERLLKLDNDNLERLKAIMIHFLWYMMETLICSLPENKIPYGLGYLTDEFSTGYFLNDMVYEWPKILYTIIILRIRKLERLIDSIKIMTGIEPKLFATDEEIKEQLQLPENPQPYGLSHFLNTPQITALYQALLGKYIASDTTLEQFQALFDRRSTGKVTPIVWEGGKGELVYLFEILQSKAKIGMAEM